MSFAIVRQTLSELAEVSNDLAKIPRYPGVRGRLSSPSTRKNNIQFYITIADHLNCRVLWGASPALQFNRRILRVTIRDL